mmetsp:Transcript_14970/g.27647  ORF Transcript_14970/g.27647 Transcript_14970/m.27647 type:complete len:699 (-) Transcript_14970:694-2790(-)
MPWKCAFCTFVNYRETFLECEICGVAQKAKEDAASEKTKTGARTSKPVKKKSAWARSRPAAPTVPGLPTQDQGQETSSSNKQSQEHETQEGSSSSSMALVDQRAQLLDEIFASERAYVDSMCVLVTHFYQPLHTASKEGKAIIPDRIKNGIFCNAHQLMSLNVELLSTMEGATKDKASMTSDSLTAAITTAFGEILPFFKMYSIYVNNYGAAVEMLKTEKTNNKAFTQFLAEKEAHASCKGLDLGAYLIMPIQRLCKYPLLFDRLLKATDASNPYYSQIQSVSQVVNQITSNVDLDRDRSEKSLRGFEIANFVSLDSLSKARGSKIHLLELRRFFRYEWSGLLSRSWSKRFGVEKKPRTVFLFSDVVLVAKKGSKGYDGRFWMPLESITLGEIQPNESPATASNASSRNSVKSLRSSSLISGLRNSTAEQKSKRPVSWPGEAKTSWNWSFSFVFDATSTGAVTRSRRSLGRFKANSSEKSRETFTFYFVKLGDCEKAREAIVNAMVEREKGPILRRQVPQVTVMPQQKQSEQQDTRVLRPIESNTPNSGNSNSNGTSKPPARQRHGARRPPAPGAKRPPAPGVQPRESNELNPFSNDILESQEPLSTHQGQKGSRASLPRPQAPTKVQQVQDPIPNPNTAIDVPNYSIPLGGAINIAARPPIVVHRHPEVMQRASIEALPKAEPGLADKWLNDPTQVQ